MGAGSYTWPGAFESTGLMIRAGAAHVSHAIDAQTWGMADGRGRWQPQSTRPRPFPYSTALYECVSSRGEASFGDKLLSAMRYEFGGHVEKSAN